MQKNLSEPVLVTKPILVFYGDLAPEYLSGTSIAAATNLNILKEDYEICHIAEEDDWTQHSKGTVHKIRKIYRHSRKLKSICKNSSPHLFYSHLPSSVGGLLKMYLLIKTVRSSSEAKIIMHLHRGDYRKNYKESTIFRKLSDKVTSMVHHLLVLSTDHKVSMEGIFPKENTHVLENTIEKEYPRNDKVHNSRLTRLLYISNYILEKGILDLLDVVVRLSDKLSLELHTYGNVFDPDLKNRIEGYHDGDKISIHGPISDQDKFDAISKACIFILPSWNEGQPLVILEAMSQFTPIIATDVGFVRETVGEDYPYLYTAKNKLELEQMIINAISDNRIELGNRLGKRYTSKYSQKAHKATLLQIFRHEITTG